MTSISKRWAWVAFGMIDAVLLFDPGSAFAAPGAVPDIPQHLPAVLLCGLGLLVTSMTGHRIRR
ncbi:MAG TPA: hypothetical protein VFN42_09705 [Acetobacteraceae bacterium]|nr:hypothetical protein [Acetobacteraceae bacterium]